MTLKGISTLYRSADFVQLVNGMGISSHSSITFAKNNNEYLRLFTINSNHNSRYDSKYNYNFVHSQSEAAIVTQEN